MKYQISNPIRSDKPFVYNGSYNPDEVFCTISWNIKDLLDFMNSKGFPLTDENIGFVLNSCFAQTLVDRSIEEDWEIFEILVGDMLENQLYSDCNDLPSCDYCGKTMVAGFTTNEGCWRCCLDCFPGALQEDYGNDWRENDHEDDSDWFGGYYDYKADDGNWYDTGIFYTEWQE